ncbi:MAG: SulP family inorganic anion transporter, partial [Halanaerobiales bacterium]
MLIDNLLHTIKNYRKAYLKDDLLAGLTVTTIALPQNMAYALIAGVDPIYGLYTSIVSMIAATFFGVSSYMIVGPTNIIALAIASSLGFLEGPEYLQGMFLLTLLVGVFQILLGVLKLGDLVNYVSHPVIVGLTTGVAILIAVGQLGNLMGLQDVNGNNAIMTLYGLGSELGNVNYYSLAVGLLTIGLIYFIKRYRPTLPAYLISLIVVVIVVYIFNFNTRVEMVRGFTSSLPAFRVPVINFTRVQNLMTSALSIALIGFIQVLSIVKSFEKYNTYYCPD